MRIPFPSISLAAKCRLLFGAAVLLLIGVALMVPWLRMTDLVHAKNIEIARQIAAAAARRAEQTPGDWKSRQRAVADWWLREAPALGMSGPAPRLIEIDPLKPEAPPGYDEYLKRAVRELARRVGLSDATPRVELAQGDAPPAYSLVRAIRSRGEELPAGALVGVVYVTYAGPRAAADITENMGLVLMAGGAAGIMAVLVFYIITQKLILSPVRELRSVADEVAGGHHNVRSRIETGDEFEDLARAFNSMLAHLEQQQEELRTINASLDTRMVELAERNVALFEANQLKSQFVANVSHELRTPLTSIIGFAELLREGDANLERTQRFVGNILESGRLLLGIINDLLDLAKIEAGKLVIHRAPVQLDSLLANLISFMTPLADKKQLQLDGTVEPGVPMIHSDSGRIQQILYNLISNAIKFSPPGGRVSVMVRREDDDHIALTVSDTGIGIPEEQIPTMFEKFRQLDGSATREYGGTGLGLAITHELVQILGGSISVRSTPGAGSHFKVILPCVAPEAAQTALPSLT